jgi:pentatricopeptide repeat protein
MQANQIAPSNFTLTILIKMFGRIGNLQQAFLLVHELPKRYGFQINAHVYTCLMSACIANKEYSKSVEVFECMKKDGVQADTKTYETALTGILRSGKYEYGLILVRDAFRLDSLHQQSFYSKVSFHAKSEYKKKQCPNQASQHSSYPIPGLNMNPYNVLMLWNQLKKNCQFQVSYFLLEIIVLFFLFIRMKCMKQFEIFKKYTA